MQDRKIILITGASSGMGKATAMKLLDEDHIVYGAARRSEKMRDLEDRGGHSIVMDITDSGDINKAVSRIMDEQERIDVLVNNAGYALYGAVEDTSLEDARRQFDVNLFGLARITKEVLPIMRKQQSGRIINMSSMGGKIFTPLGAWYHASKHALEAWSDCLRFEVKQFGIDVVIIEPGLINTEFGDVMLSPLIERSGNGPYADLAGKVAQVTHETYKKGASSPPSVIADVIVKAVQARKPKTRYAAGKMARLMIFLRRWLSDRMFDRILKSQV